MGFPFMKNLPEKEIEGFILVFFPVVSFLGFVVRIVCANLILPEYCSLFSNNIESGQACDTFSLGNSPPCAYCRDKGVALAASIAKGFGIVCFYTPFLVFLIKNRRSHSVKQTKLFDRIFLN